MGDKIIMGNTISIRLDEDFVKFAEKAQTNRIKAGTDKKTIGNPRLSKLIVKYFKLNNDRYLEFMKMENKD